MSEMLHGGAAAAPAARDGDAERFDVLVVGGGPAGLSAALVLGRCRRRVCVVDAGHPRNAPSRAAHGIFTRDGTPPTELLQIGRAQLEPYDVVVREDEVTRVEPDDGGFAATTKSGALVRARKLLLATGMRDRIPERAGLRELFGAGVYVCPYCDGWEHRDERLVMYAPASDAEVAMGLLTWSSDVTLVTPGERVADESRALLTRNGVRIVEDDVERVEAEEGRAARVVLRSGEVLPCGALFVHFGEDQAAPFIVEMGCELTPTGTAYCTDGERAGPPGVFVAGDASHDLQLVAVAVAEGVKAACAINTELRKETQR